MNELSTSMNLISLNKNKVFEEKRSLNTLSILYYMTIWYNDTMYVHISIMLLKIFLNIYPSFSKWKFVWGETNLTLLWHLWKSSFYPTNSVSKLQMKLIRKLCSNKNILFSIPELRRMRPTSASQLLNWYIKIYW